MKKYWEDKEIKRKIEKIWAKIRCGSVGKDGHKRITDASWKCVFCCRERETLAHICDSKDAEKLIKEEIVEEMKKWKEEAEGAELQRKENDSLEGEQVWCPSVHIVTGPPYPLAGSVERPRGSVHRHDAASEVPSMPL